MKIANKTSLLTASLVVGLLTACAGDDSVLNGIFPVGGDGIIHVGGIDNDGVEASLGAYTSRATVSTASRATGENTSVDAETVDWLLGPLFGGLDITYGAKDDSETEKVAILRLLKKDENGGITADNIKYSDYVGPNNERIAEYSFKYRNADGSEGDYARWYDNGPHYFQGVFVPDKLRFKPASSETPETVNDPTSGTAKALKLDQSKDHENSGNTDANYTLLERYLGMPADAYINATVGRIKLPFRHRLARVQAYVLIDPSMGTGVTVKGYKKAADGVTDVDKEDAATSAIKFCNVKVLAGVKETVDGINGHAQLTPVWSQSRKVTPHFVAERASVNTQNEVLDADNFIMFYNTELKTYIFPANAEDWITAKAEWEKCYQEALTTYAEADDPEAKAIEVADATSGYQRTLYGKVPCYDLIVRPTYTSEELVMYDEDLTGTTKENLMLESNLIDFEITLNNGLQYDKEFVFDLDANYETIVYLRINRESIDYNSSGAEVWRESPDADGYYGVNNQNGNTLSYAGSSWQRAYRIGSTNPTITDGHYYGKDDTTDADDVQDDDHMPWYPQYVSETQWLKMFAEAYMDPVTGKKGLHHGDYFILDNDITIDASQLPANFVFTGHLDGQDHTITLTGMGATVVDKPAYDENHYVEATQSDYSSVLYTREGDVYTSFSLPTLYVRIQHDADDSHNEAWYEYVLASPQPSVAEVHDGTFYADNTGTPYSLPELYANHPIHHDAVTHTAGSTLFAGLNGIYDAGVGEANVHKENDIFVPYVDADTRTGWRAEVINTQISGADMFPASAIVGGAYDVNKVSGYIYNCWKVDGTTKTAIKPHTPTLPKYK